MKPSPTPIEPPGGTLGVLLPGMGAVATTFIAGVEAVRRGRGRPFGSLTQMGTIRLGGRPGGVVAARVSFDALQQPLELQGRRIQAQRLRHRRG